MGVAKVTRNFQITLPKDIRMVVDIKVGDTLLVSQREKEVVIKKLDENPVDASFGIWKSVKDSVKFVREGRAEYEKRAKRLGI
jgi:AbrB family looped-hinge helix DNA binding protein